MMKGLLAPPVIPECGAKDGGRTEMKLGHQSRREGKRGDNLFVRNRRDKLPTNYNGRLVVVVVVVLLSVGRRRSAEEGTDGRTDGGTPGV